MINTLKYIFSGRTIPIIISTSLMLLFLGLYMLIAWKSNSLFSELKNESVILVELNDEFTGEDSINFIGYLNEHPALIKNSIHFISADEGKELMEKELGEDYFKYTEENPFLDIFRFNINNQLSSLKNFLDELEENEFVNDVFGEESFIDDVQARVRSFSRYTLFLGLFFSVLAWILIYNAIKLSLVESKNSFYTLKLLGADMLFIKKPFLQKAFYTGLFAGVVSVIVFILLITYANIQNKIVFQVVGPGSIILVSLILLILGLVINLLSTNSVLNGYLKLEEEDLYR